MTLAEMIREVYDGLGRPEGFLNPYDTDGTLNESTEGFSRLSKWINESQRAIAYWRYSDGYATTHPPLHDSIYFQGVVLTGTAQSGGDQSITLAVGVGTEDDQYNGWVVELTGGTGSGQIRLIVDFDGGTLQATLHKEWDTNPDATSTYSLYKAFWHILDSSDPKASEHIALSPVDTFYAPQKIMDLKQQENIAQANYKFQFPSEQLTATTPQLWYWDEDRLWMDVPVKDTRYFELEYMKQPADLTTGTDKPVLSSRFHYAIVLHALWMGSLALSESEDAYARKRDLQDYMDRIVEPRQARLTKAEGRFSVEGY